MSGAANFSTDDQVFVEVEVDGDGNCFYRSLFKAAKYHPDAGVFGRVLACFDIEGLVIANATNSNSSSSEGKGAAGRSKTKKKKTRTVKSDAAEENAFCDAIRQSLAEKVEADLFTEMKTAGVGNVYEAWYEAADQALGGENARWNALVEEAADELATAFPEPEIMISMDENDFKDIVATIIRDDGVYASEMDYTFVKFLLASCGITLLSAEARPKRAANISDMRSVNAEGRPVLIVRRMKRLDHYRAFITEEMYKAHKAEISPKSKSALKVSVAGLRKTLKAKGKSKSAASNSNSNTAAALAASLKNM